MKPSILAPDESPPLSSANCTSALDILDTFWEAMTITWIKSSGHGKKVEHLFEGVSSHDNEDGVSITYAIKCLLRRDVFMNIYHSYDTYPKIMGYNSPG